MVRMTSSKACCWEPDGVLNEQVMLPSAVTIMAVIRQPRRRVHAGEAFWIWLAMASGSCWLPPKMWKRSSEVPYQAKPPAGCLTGWKPRRYTRLRELCDGVSRPYSWLYAESSSSPKSEEWPPGTYCSIQSYTLRWSRYFPNCVELLYSVGNGACLS